MPMTCKIASGHDSRFPLKYSRSSLIEKGAAWAIRCAAFSLGLFVASFNCDTHVLAAGAARPMIHSMAVLRTGGVAQLAVAPGKDPVVRERQFAAESRGFQSASVDEENGGLRERFGAAGRTALCVNSFGTMRSQQEAADRFDRSSLRRSAARGAFAGNTVLKTSQIAVVLAEDAVPTGPAPVPEWLGRLFPHTGPPDKFSHRLRRLDAAEFDVDGRVAGSVIVELRYPGVDGRNELGKARIFLPPDVRDNPSHRVRLIHSAGYEIGEKGAAKLLADGYAVCTPHAHPLNPLGRGVNLDRAILHAVRRLPCIDPLRVSIQGASAGGWMTLMLAADTFPLVWARPDVPPIHWGYNAAYIAEHAEMAAAPPGSDQPRLPVLFIVGPIAEQTRTLYGMSFDDETLLAASPLAHLDTITVPTLVTFSTADTLVPIDQVGDELVKPFERSAFPDGFSTQITERFPGVSGKRTLLEALPRDRFALFVAASGDNRTRTDAGGTRRGETETLVLPFSKDRTWSIVVIDEGAVETTIGHFKYVWNMDDEPFRRWAETRGVVADQLTMPKLERMMRRLRGQPWRPFQMRAAAKGDAIAGNALDFPDAERGDVLLGLSAFATDDECATRLSECYAQLPAEWKVLGSGLGDGMPDGIRRALKALAASAR